ncbi:MAG: hypothetical protein JXR76_24180 [Deltaproteobacteria bacterium]|nr:hypothetical protein [Deltaproteobacteria bacterium]
MTRNFFYILVLLFVFQMFSLSTKADSTENSKENSEVDVPQRTPVGLEGVELEEAESGKVQRIQKRFILPPYISVKREKTEFKTVLPFFFYSERVGKGARKDVGVLPFYWAHDSEKLKSRVYFPFYWNLRSTKFKTDIVLQTYFARNDNQYHFGFAPFLFLGKNKEKGSGYQIVLPPLFFNFTRADGGTTYSLLYFNHRDKNEFSRGVVPFYFAAKKNDRVVTTVLPPLFWHVNDPVHYKTTTVLPPFFFRTRENGWSAGLLPFLYFARDKNWSRNMVMPFYYGRHVNDLRSHYLPFLLSYWKNSNELSQGGIGPFYHWYKHEGEYAFMYSPLVWRWGNTRTLERSFFLAPLFYRKDSPVEDNTMVGLIYWNYHNHNISRTFSIAPIFAVKKMLNEEGFRSLVFPTFDFGKNKDGYHFRIHPLFYLGREKEKKHLVLAPVFWRFSNEKRNSTVIAPVWWQFDNLLNKRKTRVAFPLWWQFDDNKYLEYNRVFFPFFWDFRNMEQQTRTTVTFPPLFWRVSDKNSKRTGVLNVSVHKGKQKGNDFWTFNLFPLVLFGKPPAPTGARWEILHGLAGWRRQGHSRQLKIFWIPFNLSD